MFQRFGAAKANRQRAAGMYTKSQVVRPAVAPSLASRFQPFKRPSNSTALTSGASFRALVVLTTKAPFTAKSCFFVRIWRRKPPIGT